MSNTHRQLLIHLQKARSPLHMLREEESPPTPPPKDPGYITATGMDNESSMARPASGSKRKREAQQDDNVYEMRNGQLELAHADSPTPQKRSRSNTGRSDGGRSSDATPAQRHQGSLRRKQGVGNLSNLNLRHAAARQNKSRSQSPTGRESRFQEGSLTDKPSQQPPSAFTRFIRSESGNLTQVEELMHDYHNGVNDTADTVDEPVQRETFSKNEHQGKATDNKKNEGGGGIFRFGKSFASGFHPIALWNKVWNESKEELTRRNILEAQRKAKMRAEAQAEAQAKYDQMKQDGKFKPQHVVFAGNPAAPRPPVQETSALASIASNGQTYQRQASLGSSAAVAQVDGSSFGGSQTAEVPPSTAKPGRFSRLHLRTPSISNLRSTLRSVRSHSALGGAIEREPSSSASPVKADMDHSTLRKSVSRFDLKKERRLSKRVSDLESKLLKARMELSTALDDASPAPKFGNKYERFTPLASSRRSRFVPGALPTLPSERLMFPTGPDDEGTDEPLRPFASTTRPRNALDLNTAFDNIDDEEEEDEEETMRVKRKMPYPTRADEVFQPMDTTEDGQENNYGTKSFQAAIEDDLSSDPIALDDKELDTPASLSDDDMEEATQSPDFDSLGNKLEVLNDSPKSATASKKPRSKKRHFDAADDADPLFVPDPDDEQSTEFEDTNPKKKRKSTSKSRGSSTKKTPANKATKKSSIPVPSPNSKTPRTAIPTSASNTSTVPATAAENVSEDELIAPTKPVRTSIDSEVTSLDPVFEEEEDLSTIPLKNAPAEPTALSTPARYGHNAVRTRSKSPHKRSDSLQPGAMDHVNMKRHRPMRSNSPPPLLAGQLGMPIGFVDGEVSIVPGQAGVPHLPKGANGSFESLVKGGNKKDEPFEWPEDVF
ncbi:unnamed protein product [Zymoseptoria tritici ST99CH_3D1]|nr:unnamed protein product [Zymoseptoria tritici ST99CH_3D1]